MSKEAVIDSNVLIAIVDSRDNWHARAHALLESLVTEDVRVIYFDCVLNETISVLARRSEEQKRPEQFSSLLDTLLQKVSVDNITWISSETQRLYLDTVEQVRQTSGILNFHDALMTVYCRELGIKTIVSFDRDFESVAWLTRIAKPEDVKTTFDKIAAPL